MNLFQTQGFLKNGFILRKRSNSPPGKLDPQMPSLNACQCHPLNGKCETWFLRELCFAKNTPDNWGWGKLCPKRVWLHVGTRVAAMHGCVCQHTLNGYAGEPEAVKHRQISDAIHAVRGLQGLCTN